MIIGAEVAMLVLGVYILIKNKALPSKKAKYVVQGWPLRCIGMIFLLPIPLTTLAALVVGFLGAAMGKDVGDPSFYWMRTAIQGSIVAVCLLGAAIIGRVYRVRVDEPQAESLQA
jgi:hypothetical protein